MPLTPLERFEYALTFVLKHEGGYSDNKKDPGGPTNYGVSLKFLKTMGIDITHDGEIDRDDILALNKETAVEVYRKYWWDKYRYEAINEIEISKKIFDFSVNMGPSRAHRMAQLSARLAFDNNDSLAIDGIFGFKTIESINRGTEEPEGIEKYLALLKQEAEGFYESLVNHHPELVIFLNGWRARAND